MWQVSSLHLQYLSQEILVSSEICKMSSSVFRYSWALLKHMHKSNPTDIEIGVLLKVNLMFKLRANIFNPNLSDIAAHLWTHLGTEKNWSSLNQKQYWKKSLLKRKKKKICVEKYLCKSTWIWHKVLEAENRLQTTESSVWLWLKLTFISLKGYLIICLKIIPTCWVLNNLPEVKQHFKVVFTTHRKKPASMTEHQFSNFAVAKNIVNKFENTF